MKALDTGVRKVRNVGGFVIGKGSVSDLPQLLQPRRKVDGGFITFFIDCFFEGFSSVMTQLQITPSDQVIFVDTNDEPSTETIDRYSALVRAHDSGNPSAIVGMGGGVTMDTAKAVANLITNQGKAEEYQGWDLVKNPSVYKIAIPTISGTGAEATRTCVMTNKRTGLKLGMNSDFTVYDHIIMDPELSVTVPKDQYFYTGMDAYIHCIEALAGNYRNAVGDALSRETVGLCLKVFQDTDMMSLANRERLMVASYLGGSSIATSYVGLIHPLSAGLSVVLGLHHCVANCIVMRAMEAYYPEEYNDFWEMAEIQKFKR